LRTVTTYGLIAALAVWLSMGPGLWRPYNLLYNFVPGFNGMRVPARLASVVVLALSVLAGGGFAWLFNRLPRRLAAIAAIAFGAVIVVEGQHGVGVQEVPGGATTTGTGWRTPGCGTARPAEYSSSTSPN
jgi:hypothetical protein